MKNDKRPFVIWMAFSIGLWLANEQCWYFYAFGLLLITLFPQRRWQGIMLLTFSGWIILDNRGWADLNAVYEWTMAELVVFRSAIVVFNLLFCGTWLVIIKRTPGLSRHPFLTLVGIFIFLLVSSNFISKDSFLGYCYFVFLIIFTKSFWYLAYAAVDRMSSSSQSLLRDIMTLQPFWSSGVQAPVPGSGQVLERFEAKSSNEIQICQIKGLKLLYWILFIKLLVSAFDYLILSNPNWIFKGLQPLPFQFESFKRMVNFGYSGWRLQEEAENISYGFLFVWLAGIYVTFKILLGITIQYGVVVAMARMCGFHIFRHTYKPYRARSIADFFSRWMYYYAELIRKLFIMPLFLELRFIQIRALRIFLSFFLGVFLCGALYHLGWFVPSLAKYPLEIVLYKFSLNLPYFAVLALIISLSVVFRFERILSRFGLGIIGQNILYMVIYGLIISLGRFMFFGGGWSDYWRFIAPVFGFTLKP